MKKLISIKTDEIIKSELNIVLKIVLFLFFLTHLNYSNAQNLTKGEIMQGIHDETIQFKDLDEFWKNDREICLSALVADGLNLQYIESSKRNNNDFIQTAIRNNGYSINYVDFKKLNNIDSIRDIFDDSEINAILKNVRPIYIGHVINRSLKIEPVDLVSEISGYLLNIVGEKKQSQKTKEIKLEPLKTKQEVLKDSSNFTYAFYKIPKEFQNDTNIIFNVLKYDINVIFLLNDQLKEDFLTNKKTILRIAKINPDILKFVDDKYRKNKRFVVSAIRQNGRALRYVDPKFQKTKSIVLEAIKNDSGGFIWASPELKKEKEFVKKAIKINSGIDWLIDDSLRNDPEIQELLKKQ